MVEKQQWNEPEKAVQDSIAELRKLKRENQRRKLNAELAVENDPAKRLEILAKISKLK